MGTDFSNGFVFGQSDISKTMKDIEPIKMSGVDHISVPFPKRITGVFRLCDNLFKRVNESLQVPSHIRPWSRACSDADDDPLLSRP
jgi:hypothetical protein